MDFSVIIIDDSEGYRNILKITMQRFSVPVAGIYSHAQFKVAKIAGNPDIAIIGYAATFTDTFDTVAKVKNDFQLTGVALLVSGYDAVSQAELKQLDIDGAMYKATDDISELMTMLEKVSIGEKYFHFKKIET